MYCFIDVYYIPHVEFGDRDRVNLMHGILHGGEMVLIILDNLEEKS